MVPVSAGFLQISFGNDTALGISHVKVYPIIGKFSFTGGIAVVKLMRKKKKGLVFMNIYVSAALIYMESSPAYQDQHEGVDTPALVKKTSVTDQIAAGEKFCRIRSLCSTVQHLGFVHPFFKIVSCFNSFV